MPCKSRTRCSSISHACQRPIDRRWNKRTVKGELFFLRRDDLFLNGLHSISDFLRLQTICIHRGVSVSLSDLFLFYVYVTFMKTPFLDIFLSLLFIRNPFWSYFLLSFILSHRNPFAKDISDRIEILSLQETNSETNFGIQFLCRREELIESFPMP